MIACNRETVAPSSRESTDLHSLYSVFCALIASAANFDESLDDT